MNVIMILDNAFEPDVRVYNEAKSLIEHGHTVEILCYDGRGQFLNKPIEIIDGIKIRRFFMRSKIGTFFTDKLSFKFHLLFYPIWLIKFYIACKKYIKSINQTIDYIYSHDLICATASSIFFKRYKKVFDMHELYKKTEKDHIYNLISKRAMGFSQKRAKFIVHVNNEQKKMSNNSFYDKMIELPNYPILSKYTIEKTTEKFTVSYIGLVRRDDLILNLCEALRDIDCNVKIYGKGLSDIAANKVNSYNNAHYYGSFDGAKEAKKLFVDCDLLYSLYDPSDLNWKTAMPVKFFEAMASGTPVIASMNTVYGDFVIQNKLGYVIKWDSIDEIRQSVNSAMQNKKHYQELRNHCIEIRYRFSWSDKIDEFIKILEEQAI